ncbi:NUDIX hydrolase [Nonomuraea ferruginea]|uniref:NUDIX hydrolase n=1 Tax=Nonomuraea ferruginea TaxID=46174 RepID=A0ABT4TAP0_9ACTN|nr:NUDIX hydrolase [Nonomuraea ferruginea]MDA0646031.1 NUDIX hydrolase [Nonomuraea ferruginea]
MTTDPLRAAGAVIWRGEESRPEVALVHRPRYDDWTFPKGKLKSGEHVIAAALREVREETGLTVALDRALPPVHYPHGTRLKRVDYWAGRVAEEGPFVAGDEVDELRWLPVDQARELLTYEWDAGLLRALSAAPLATVPLVLVRHASAGSRQTWQGADSLRPLDAEGLAQAAALATVLPAYRPAVLLSSPSLRCVQTLAPYSSHLRLEPLLSEEGQDPRKTTALVGELTERAAVCSHGKVLPPLIAALSGRDVRLRKGAFAVLHRVGERVVCAERYGL